MSLFVNLFVSPGIGREPVPNEFEEQLILPRSGYRPDKLTLWVAHNFIPFYHRIWQVIFYPLRQQFQGLFIQRPRSHWHREREVQDPAGTNLATNFANIGEKNLTAYSVNHIFRVMSITITLVACLLPTLAIIVLSKIDSKDLVLGLITAFTALFALGLVFFSSSSSKEKIFGATIG